MRILFACLLIALGCDPNAKATAGDSAGGSQSNKPSKLYESCASSADCEGELRCFSNACVSPGASVKGDYYAALGDVARATGRADLALKALRNAEAEYRAEDLEPPPTLMCSLGRALAEQRLDPILAEEAASRLHRCLLGAPAGSSLRARALKGLAVLDEVGLDPVHLASDEVVDRYLTKAPRKPPTSKLSMKVSSNARTRARSFSNWMEAARGDAVKEALTPCWEAYWKATRKTKMVITLPFRHSFRLDQYDDFDRATLTIEDLSAESDEAQRAANQCAKNALEPIADEHSRRTGSESRWTAKIAFELDT